MFQTGIFEQSKNQFNNLRNHFKFKYNNGLKSVKKALIFTWNEGTDSDGDPYRLTIFPEYLGLFDINVLFITGNSGDNVYY
jgi:hypothetical protein